MNSPRSSARLTLLFAAALAGCGTSRAEVGAGASAQPSAVTAATPAPADEEGDRCRARVAELQAAPELPGAPGFEQNRIAILGRARGEPMVFVRTPKQVDPETLPPEAKKSLETFTKARPPGRVLALVKRHKTDKPMLRTLLLREGYTYAEEPADALALAADVKLVDLFDETTIYLQRGVRTHKLARVLEQKESRYVFDGGPLAGITADLLFGDRVALAPEELGAPLHRDLAALSEEQGFDRTKIVRTTDKAIVADLRFGAQTVRAVLDSEGAAVRLSCLTADPGARAAVDTFREQQAPRLRALASVREAITAIASEQIRFDRPLDEKGPDKDGQLRPAWMTAYLQGRTSFNWDDRTYPVYDTQGRAWPPMVCVDFVLDSFERAGGSWFRPKADKPGKTLGRFTWIDDMRQVRGVIGFGERAEKHPELFEVRRFAGRERIPFSERVRFFQFLTDHADEIRPGDVVAIHGMKRDDRIHQHAIFVERTDPITGFAYGLADQMRRPRRRSWEGIMAEAPKRSLLFRVHPRDAIFTAIDPAEPVAAR
jgi:hypothetical protein